MNVYDDVLENLRYLRDEEELTMDEAVQCFGEEMQDSLIDKGLVHDEAMKAVKTFIEECGGKISDYF
jgi:hypothetical protein